MKVILLEEIPGLGELGAVVRVKDGFARNFLFPRRKADRATKSAVEEFERRRAELEERQRAQMAALENARAALDGCNIRISAKAGPDGGLYGSVTAAMVAAAVNRVKPEGIADIAKGQVHMQGGHLKHLGEATVDIVLRPGLRARVIVEVAAEGEEGAESAAAIAENVIPDFSASGKTGGKEDKLKDAVLAAAESAKAESSSSSRARRSAKKAEARDESAANDNSKKEQEQE